MKVRVNVENVLVANYTDLQNITGATILLFPDAAKGVAITLGGASSTRNFDSLTLTNNSHPIYALTVTGGSAFGLSVADGVARYLLEIEKGIRIDELKIPIVPTCVIFDLFIGNPKAPDPEGVYRALKSAGREIEVGSVGAGTGAVVGKLFGVRRGTKSGIGYSEESIKGTTIGVLSVVNAFGDIKENGAIIAGTLDEEGKFINTSRAISIGVVRKIEDIDIQNTTIVIVMVDAQLTKREAYRIALMTSAGMAEVIDPVWTPYDGDIVIVLSTGKRKLDTVIIGTIARKLTSESILMAVKEARSVDGIPSFRNLSQQDT